jgi:hypothetical protein
MRLCVDGAFPQNGSSRTDVHVCVDSMSVPRAPFNSSVMAPARAPDAPLSALDVQAQFDAQVAAHLARLLDPSRFVSDAVRVYHKKQSTRVLVRRDFDAGALIFDEEPLFVMPRERRLLPSEVLDVSLRSLGVEASMSLLNRCAAAGVRLAHMRAVWHMRRAPVALVLDTDAKKRLAATAGSNGFSVDDAHTMLELLVEHTRASASLLSAVALSDVLSPFAMHVQHACAPNVLVVYAERDTRVRVYALRRIARDEALTYCARPDVVLEHQVITHWAQLPCEACAQARAATRPSPEAYQAWLGAHGIAHSDDAMDEWESVQPKVPPCAVCDDRGETRQLARSLSRAMLMAERTHRACTCARCRDETTVVAAAVQEKRAPYFNARKKDVFTVCTVTRRQAIAQAGRRGDVRLFVRLVESMDELVLYGVVNEMLCALAQRRWPIARAHRVATCPAFDHIEALDAARAWLWGGETVLYTSETRVSAAAHVQPATLRMVREAVEVLVHSVRHTFRASPSIAIARLQALGMVAGLHARMPTLARAAPLSDELLDAMRAEPLLRVVLVAEEQRLCCDAPVLAHWYDVHVRGETPVPPEAPRPTHAAALHMAVRAARASASVSEEDAVTMFPEWAGPMANDMDEPQVRAFVRSVRASMT